MTEVEWLTCTDPQKMLDFLGSKATRDTAMSAARNCSAEAARTLNNRDSNHCDPAELEAQTNLIRDIFGNPFRPLAIDPSWLTPSITSLDQTIYNDAFDRMPELADDSRRGKQSRNNERYSVNAGPRPATCSAVIGDLRVRWRRYRRITTGVERRQRCSV